MCFLTHQCHKKNSASMMLAPHWVLNFNASCSLSTLGTFAVLVLRLLTQPECGPELESDRPSNASGAQRGAHGQDGGIRRRS